MKTLLVGLAVPIVLLNASIAQAEILEFQGHGYQLFEQTMTWTAAQAHAESLGGYLACVTSMEETDFLVNVIEPGEFAYGLVWIGGEKIGNDWTWVSGEAFSFENWGFNEPNFPASEFHLSMFSDNDYGYIPGTWADATAEQWEWPFVVEWDVYDNGTVSAEEMPTDFALEQCHPNPLNPSTVIDFSLNETANASLIVYNLGGQEVARLVDGLTARGAHSVTFDANSLSSGVYFYTLDVNGIVATRKMVLAR